MGGGSGCGGGGGGGSAGYSDGSGTSALFNSPYGIAIDSANKYLYIADNGNNCIRRVTISGVLWCISSHMRCEDSLMWYIRAGATVVTFVGSTFGSSGFTDGVGSSARLNSPWGIAVSSDNYLYVTDSGNNAIRRVSVNSKSVTTWVGPGRYGTWSVNWVGIVDGVGTLATFYAPQGIAMDSLLNVYVGDYGNNLVRKISPSGT